MGSKEKADKKQKNNGRDRNTKTNEVLVTVYVESSTPRSQKLSNPMTKTKANQPWKGIKSGGKQGYDRRAQLLAYTRQLRNASSQEGGENKVPSITDQSRTKTKRCIWLTRICAPSSQVLRRSGRRRKYERLASKESRQANHQSRKKGNEGDNSSFLMKVKNMLREMSCKEIEQ
ncbi:hypothetical protein L6164_016140 [Bauhinia variegata]|uniref:Uncharacterized protein n=1 Tax=Bauhinia variegata TaxID=167791 RepID=A0ACB9NPP1_BAUVA|nr:hypothetical protein L6164_016140 [Bauhinia variegata]